MNKYFRAVVDGSYGLIKTTIIKVFRFHNFKVQIPCFIAPFTEITMERTAKLFVGSKFRMRSGAKIRVRNNASLTIGNDISLNHGCMLVCREEIVIGSGVQFGPNVLVYDHDHDYKVPGGIAAKKYKTEKIIIGDNVWIGANCVILKGTIIGDNSVVAAGSVVRGEFPVDSLIYQERTTKAKHFELRDITMEERTNV